VQIFAGLDAALDFIRNYRFKDTDIEYLRSQMPTCDSAFFTWLATLDCSSLKIYAIPEGSVCFPHEPLIRVEGPLAIGQVRIRGSVMLFVGGLANHTRARQLLETTLLNLVNFASLVTTNAARYRLAAGDDKTLLEFGLRRAQGPDGAMSASRYCYMGGFDATSNVLAGQIFGIGIRGTHAHSFVSAFTGLNDVTQRSLKNLKTGKEVDFVEVVKTFRQKLQLEHGTNEGELAAFTGYAICFPSAFVALVDTYNTLKSGVPNFCVVALALLELGYKPLGVRLDSGDIAYLSRETRNHFRKVAHDLSIPEFEQISISASNEISEQTLLSLDQQEHSVDTFGIGTNLVTCAGQTALGGVYKLVSINGIPRLKISQELSKVSIPACKTAYRLLDSTGVPLLDLLAEADDEPPKAGSKIMCRHPFLETKRAYVVPSQVEQLHQLVWNDGKVNIPLPTLQQLRERVKQQITHLRADHLRFLNPTPYKVSVTQKLYEMFHSLWLEEAPIEEIK
jgi:nicotinate phosphoribosyltransferase